MHTQSTAQTLNMRMSAAVCKRVCTVQVCMRGAVRDIFVIFVRPVEKAF